MERAERAVQRWSRAIGKVCLPHNMRVTPCSKPIHGIHSVCALAGVVQRFSLGFRGPICLFAGFLGVKPSVFGAGVAVGAFGTMALQITAVRPRRPCLMLRMWDWGAVMLLVIV